MKITFVEQNIDGMGGVERIICTLANAFAKDNQVSVINEEKKNAKSFFKYDDDIRIENILDFSNTYTTSLDNSMFSNAMKIIRKVKRKIVLLFLPNRIKKLLYESDIIIFGRTTVAFKYLKLFLRKKERPIIIVRDASNLFCINNSAKKKIKKYFPLLVDKFIVSSDESIKAYKKFFGDKKVDMVKIYNPLGIEPNAGFSFLSKEIVSLGRFDKQKGFENLILAFNLINKKYPDWSLSIYGKGSYSKVLKKLISNNKIPNVQLKNPEKDVTKVFNNAAIYVMSSRFEGYANCLVEALACGIPCITYDWLTGADEIVKNNENGLIAHLDNREEYLYGKTSVKDVECLADALIKLIENEQLCNRLSENAIKIFETRNKETIIEQWKKIIYKKND